MLASMSKHESRERYISKLTKVLWSNKNDHAKPPKEQSGRLRTSPTEHYHIAKVSRDKFDLSIWLNARAGDRAIQASHIMSNQSTHYSLWFRIFEVN
jgi:hypothetical protein